MTATLAMIREKFGGAEGYKTHAGLSDEDLMVIRRNLVVST